MKNQKKITVILLVSALMMLSIGGCNNSQNIKQETLTSYEVVGTSLEGLHQTAKELCDAKQVSGKTCNQMVKMYEKARASYRLAGDSIILAGRSMDSIVQKQYQDIYTTQINQAIDLLGQLKDLVNSMKK